MAKMFNRARMTVTSTGTGALSLGVAVAGYQTFSSAGAQNNDVVSYAVEDGLKWEIGTGTYNSVAGTLSRTVTQSFDGTTYGTSAISVTTSAQVFISPLAADLQYGTSAGNLVQLDGSARLPAVDGSLITSLNATNITNGTLSVSRGGTGLNSLTAGYIPYGNGTGAFSSSANFTYDTNGNLGVGNSPDTTTLGRNITINGVAAGTNTGLVFQNAATQNGLIYTNNSFMYVGTAQSIPLLLGTVNAERMRIDGSGNVGIGCSPSSRLDVQSATVAATGVSSALTLRQVGDGGLSLNFVNGVTTHTNPLASIRALVESAGAGTDDGILSFSTSTNAVTSERMRIDSSGNVGIGTASSNNLLEIRKDQNADTALWINNRYATSSGTTNSLIFGGFRDVQASYQIAKITAIHSGGASGDFNHAGALAFYTMQALGAANPEYPTERMRIDSVGNVGIGTSSPAAKLEVAGAGDTRIRLNNTANTVYAEFGAAASETFFAAYNSKPFNIYTGGSSALYIDASRNVGIGTSTLNARLQFANEVASTAGSSNKISLYYGSATAAFGLGISSGQMTYNCGDGAHVFYANGNTSPVERMRIDSSGNVGIGSSPIAKFSVNGDSFLAYNGSSGLLVRNNSGTENGIDSYNYPITANYPFRILASQIRFLTQDTERVRIDTSGNLLTGGKTTATSNSGDIQVSRGIGFPATQVACSDANTLDDYEEGAWAPTLATGTWNLRNATYTKIGRQVTVELWADTFSSTVNIINGLPFVVNSNGYSPGVAHNNSGNAYVARAGTSSTDVYLRNYADASIALNSMGSFLIFTITYFTT